MRECHEHVSQLYKTIMAQRESLLTAFIAETGALPSECVQIIETRENIVTCKIEKLKVAQ